MEDCTVQILGQEWKIFFRKREEDTALQKLDGYCDRSIRTIVIRRYNCPAEIDECQDPNMIEKQALRHEIIHAHLFESGLAENSKKAKAWATNEEMIDWIAAQHEKLHRAFEEAGAV